MTKPETQITAADRETIALLLQEMNDALVESGRKSFDAYESGLVSMGCAAGLLYERTRANISTVSDREAAEKYAKKVWPNGTRSFAKNTSYTKEDYLAGILHERARAEYVLVQFIEHYLECDLALQKPDAEISCFARDAREVLKTWWGEKS